MHTPVKIKARSCTYLGECLESSIVVRIELQLPIATAAMSDLFPTEIIDATDAFTEPGSLEAAGIVAATTFAQAAKVLLMTLLLISRGVRSLHKRQQEECDRNNLHRKIFPVLLVPEGR